VLTVHGEEREPPDDDQTDLLNLMQALQIQVSDLSTQVLTILEIIVEHRQGQQQLQDECAALRSQLEELRFQPSSIMPSRTVTTSSEGAPSPGPNQHIPDLNSPPDPEDVASGSQDPPAH
jgi:hypothetical protein